MINFNDTALAFKAKSDKELKRTYRLFRMIDSPILTKIGPKLITLAFQLRLPVKGLVKKTLFDIFVGGESLEDSVKTSAYLDSFGVKTILDYSVEGEKTAAGFDATKDEIIDTLDHGGKHTEVAFSACKLTGLAPFKVMEKVQQNMPLNEKEKQSLKAIRGRMEEIAQAARRNHTPIFIDAEESWIQDFIDDLAEDLMERYNQEKPLIHTTVQLYRWDRLEYLKALIEKSKEKGYILGVKLVRGAYLEKETDRAEEMDYKNPMQPNKAATDRDYDAALTLCLDHIDHVAVCAGTHNEASSRHLAKLMAERKLPPSHPNVFFAQLLGMSDNISFNLAHAGYNVAKYLPYGPVKAVLPYLIRRAEENTAVAGQASRETDLLKREIRRRRTLQNLKSP